MITFERLSAWSLILYFIFYLVSHMIIGQCHKQLKAKLDINPTDETVIKNYKWLNLLFKWYPAIYLVFIVLVLM